MARKKASKNQVAVGNITDSGEVNIAAGDIIKKIKIIYQRALTAAEEAAGAHKLERELLAQGVATLMQNLAAQASEDPQGDSPYKGLLPYSLNEAEIFYGRNKAKKALLDHIRQSPLTVLHAESGAGKSSLLQAGIAAQQISNGGLAVYLRPHHAELVEFIKRMFLPELSQAPSLAGGSLRDFLHQVCGVLGSKSHLYLLLDQFEEFFQLKKDDRQLFFESLVDCLNDSSLNVRWVLSLRKEALSDLAELESYGITQFKNTYRLNRLSRTEAQEAMVEPARRHRITFEPALTEHILDALTTNDEVRPTHLQLVCSALTDDLPEDKTLTLRYYTEHKGGTEGILRDYLKRQLEDMPTAEQALAWKLLRALITADRRRAVKTNDEIIQELKTGGVSKKQIETMLSKLIERRLIFAQIQPAREETFELAHDYLIKDIELDPQEQALKAAQEFLDQETRTYQRHRTLLTAERLVVIEPYQNKLRLSVDSKTLLSESQKAIAEEQRLRERRRRIAVAISIAVAVAMSFLALWGFRSSEEAQKQARIARAGELAAKSELIGAVYPQQGLLLALEAMSATIPHLPVAEQALRDGLSMIGGIGLAGHEEPVTTLAFSPDNRWLATGSGDATVRLWDLQKGAVGNDRVLQGHTASITRVAFSLDGHWLATSGWDKKTQLWDLRNLASQPQILSGHDDAVLVSAFSPDGRWLATGSFDTTVLLWDLQARDIAASRRILLGLQHHVSNLAFSPDARWLAVRDKNDAIRIWDLSNSNPSEATFLLAHPDKSIMTFAFSPDSRWVATGGTDQKVRLWELSRLAVDQHHEELLGHTEQIQTLSFSPDGYWLATGSLDKTTRLWKIANDEFTAKPRLLTGKDEVHALEFSLSGHLLATGYINGTTQVWDLAPLQADQNAVLESHTFHASLGSIDRVAFSPDENWLATVSSDNVAWIWNLAADDPTKEPIILRDIMSSTLTFSQDGRWLGTSSKSANVTARLWDLANNPSAQFNVLTDSVGEAGVVVSPNNGWIATSTTKNTVQLWKSTDFSAFPDELTAHLRRINAMSFNTLGNLLATAGTDNQICLWDIPPVDEATGPALRECFSNYVGWISRLAFSPKGRWLAAASSNLTVQLRDLTAKEYDQSPELLQVLPVKGLIAALKFSPDDHWLAVGNLDPNSTLELWNMDDLAQPIRLQGHGSIVPTLDFSPDGNWLATGSQDGTLILWDLTVPVPSIDFSVKTQTEGTISTVQFSPNGRWLAAAGDSTNIYIWDLRSERPLEEIKLTLTGHNGLIHTLVFNPTGTLLATGSEDNTIRLWDLSSDDPSKSVIVLRGHKNKIIDLSFSSDGHWLISGSLDRSVRFWNLNMEELKEMACSFAGRNFSREEWAQYFANEEYRKTCPDWPMWSAAPN